MTRFKRFCKFLIHCLRRYLQYCLKMLFLSYPVTTPFYVFLYFILFYLTFSFFFWKLILCWKMFLKYHHKICYQPLAKSYDNCDVWVHTECSKINKQTYKLYKSHNTKWCCIVCFTKGFLPFFKLNNDKKVHLYYQWLKAKIHSCSFVSCIKQSSNPKRCKFDVRIRWTNTWLATQQTS